MATEQQLMDMLEPNLHILYYEPAHAAAKVLAFYWSGMEPEALRPEMLKADVSEVAKLLLEWVDDIEQAGVLNENQS